MTKNEILISLSESERTKFGKEAFAVQSFPQKVFSSVWAVESEVNNGGFSQYFPNSSAETAAFVAEALDTIGAPRTAHICRCAVERAFPEGLPPTAEEISSAASDFSDELLAELDSSDREFLAYLTTSRSCCLIMSVGTRMNSGPCRHRLKRGHRVLDERR